MPPSGVCWPGIAVSTAEPSSSDIMIEAAK
jgi:hypothetical protein